MKKRKGKDKLINNTMDSFDLVQKYGTYEIQETASSDNEFPKIAQGLPGKINNPKNHRQE